jgi:hypothetical protein
MYNFRNFIFENHYDFCVQLVKLHDFIYIPSYIFYENLFLALMPLKILIRSQINLIMTPNPLRDEPSDRNTGNSKKLDMFFLNFKIGFDETNFKSHFKMFLNK